MADVEFTHHDDCTFETLLKRFAISDPAAHRIGEMIHDADLEDAKFQRTECIGLDLLFKGLSRPGLGDATILEKGFACFDGLHAAVKRQKGRWGLWPFDISGEISCLPGRRRFTFQALAPGILLPSLAAVQAPGFLPFPLSPVKTNKSKSWVAPKSLEIRILQISC